MNLVEIYSIFLKLCVISLTTVTIVPTEEEGDCPCHIVVSHLGHHFAVDLTDNSGDPLTAPEIQTQLGRVKAAAAALGPPQGVNFLTALERTAWAKVGTSIGLFTDRVPFLQLR